MTRSAILRTNLSVFLTILLGFIAVGLITEFYEYVLGASNKALINVFLIGVLGSFFSFFTYGLLFWPALLIFNFLVEGIVLKKQVSLLDIKYVFVIESVLVTCISVIIAANYHKFYWLCLIPLYISAEIIRFKVVAKNQRQLLAGKL
tara:strand:+ start:3821 stop:4261 length:441 start_codon:yes stop_codon:yes gene_type:complete